MNLFLLALLAKSTTHLAKRAEHQNRILEIDDMAGMAAHFLHPSYAQQVQNPLTQQQSNQINPLVNQFINATTPQARQQATTQLQQIINLLPTSIQLTQEQKEELVNSIQRLSNQRIETFRLLAASNNSPLQRVEHQIRILEIDDMAGMAEHFLYLSFPQQQR